MCGIIGYIGQEEAKPYLLNGLERLEYRGYDSAGIAILDNGKIQSEKSKGQLSCLKEKIGSKGQSLKGSVGIGHTRWATHGAVTDANAHPHLSRNGAFAVVHNGIIENYGRLKEELISEGYTFSSETDTEVIANLLEKYYSGSLLNALSKTCERLIGSFALAVICKDSKDKIICTRRASPLIIGTGSKGSFIASDIAALSGNADKVFRPEENEIAVVKQNSVAFYGKDLQPVTKEAVSVGDFDFSADKGDFEHFMLKEIYEQPRAVRDTVEDFDFDKIASAVDLGNINKIYIVACGSAYHVGVMGKYVIEALSETSVEVDIASEFRYRRPVIDGKTLVIAISQSGETADTLAAVRLAKDKGSKVLSVINVPRSSIAEESDCVIYTRAGAEVAVATTKAYSAQLAVIYLLAVHLSAYKGVIEEKTKDTFISQIRELPEKIENIFSLKETVRETAKELKDCGHIYFIGRNTDFAVALEASLKMKEISYIHCEAYGAGELKHGTLSLIEKGTPVICLGCNDTVFKKTASNIKEVQSRGGRAICFTTERHADEIGDADKIITIPEFNPLFNGSVLVVLMQLLSYYTAKEKGCEIDKPRNLAKSVTVE